MTDNRANAGGGFKVGDRIRFVDKYNESTYSGGTFVGDEFVAVSFDNRHNESAVHYLSKEGKVSWRPGEYFELVSRPIIDVDKWNAPALRAEYRERLNTLTIAELPQFIQDLLSERIEWDQVNAVTGLISSAAHRALRDKIKRGA